MVNRGRPSRGCNNCKRRRIQCDETRPSCKKCELSGRTCPGVPDDFELIFRDQTKKVTTKAHDEDAAKRHLNKKQASSRKALGSPSSEISDLHEDEPGRIVPNDHDEVIQLPLVPHANPSRTDQAIAFFMHNFIGLSPEKPWRGHLDELHFAYMRTTPSSPLSKAVDAIALRTLADHHRSEELQNKALSSYGLALRTIGEAINDKERSKTNDTLMSVLMLMLYENTMGSLQSLDVYMKHMEGAASLLRNRGEDNFADDASRSIYRAIRSQLTCRYTQAGKRLDPMFTREDLSHDNRNHQQTVHDRVYLNGVEVNRLRARSQELKSSPSVSTSDVLDLLAWAENIEARLVDWENGMLEVSSEYSANRKFHNGLWHCRVVPACSNGRVDVDISDLNDEYLEDAPTWPGIQYLQIYNSAIEATNCNSFRTFRIFVHAVIILWLSWLGRAGDAIDSDRYNQSLRVVQELVDGICASVPCLLGYQFNHQSNERTGPSMGRTPAAIARSSIMAIHPLYTSLCVETIPQKQRTWVAGRLRAIARERGWKQAGTLSGAEPSLIFSGKPFGGIFGMWDRETNRRTERRLRELKQTWPFV